MAQNTPKLVKWEELTSIGDAASSYRYKNEVSQKSVLSLTSPLTLNKSLNLSETYFFSLKKKCVCVCVCVSGTYFFSLKKSVCVCVCVCVGGSKKWVIILSLFFLQLIKVGKTKKEKEKKKKKEGKIRKAQNSFKERNQKILNEKS